MIPKNIKNILLTGLVGCAMGAALTACSDWDDHYGEAADAEGNSVGGATLWQLIKADPQLSDFSKVLEQTKMTRQRKKSSVSYADLLNGDQSFTVMAPVNGTFDVDALLEKVETYKGDSAVATTFVQNHLSRNICSMTDDTKSILLLNGKHAQMGGGMVDDVVIEEPNIRASNGVLHITETQVPFKPNIFEALTDMGEYQKIGEFLNGYTQYKFYESASVSDGMIDGVKHYVDSVFYLQNKMLDQIGYINQEDSTYWMVVPTEDEWNRVWEETSKYFVYASDVNKGDSLQQYWTMRALLDDAVFNMNEQPSPEDSLCSVPYVKMKKGWTGERMRYKQPEHHVFYEPYAEGGILNGATELKLTNGSIWQTSKWPYTPERTFFKEVWTEGESVGMILSYDPKKCSYNPRYQVADSISENGYLQIVPASKTSAWDMTFRIDNTLSGDYDICVVLLPKSVNGITDDILPNKFKATLTYFDEKGATKTETFGAKQFKNDPLKVDTVVLKEGFHFPACNKVSTTNQRVTLKIAISINPTLENKKYSREMYLDCIYLRPRTPKTEEE